MPTPAITSSPFPQAPIKPFSNGPSTLTIPAPAPAAPAPQPQTLQSPQVVPQSTPQPAPTGTSSTPPGLDPIAFTLTKAIGLQETGGNYNAVGKSGEYGAYQYIPDTWAARAAAAGINAPLQQATPEQQNQVMYTWVKSKLDAGYTPAQIASMQNAGDHAPDAYKGNAGVNSSGVRYDTAAYVQGVQKQAEQLYAQQAPPQIQAGVNQPAPTPGQPSFLGNLGQDINNRAQNLAANDANYAAGKVGVISHVLQDAGQVAGGFGDAFNEALGALDRTFTGGAIGGALGAGVKSLASTAPGQAVAKAIADFQQAHPEAAANIGAIANIASLFPVGKAGSLGLKGLEEGAAKLGTTELAQSAGASAAKSVASNLEDIFTNSSKSTVRDTFEHMLDRGQNPAQVLVERKLATQIPIEDGHVRIPDNSPVITSLDKEIAAKSDLLTAALSKVRTTIPADEMKSQVDNIISQNRTFRQQGRIPEMQARAAQIIDNYVAQEGKTRFKLTDIQGMKQGQTALSSMFRKAQDFGKADEHSALGFAFQKMIEDKAPDVAVRQLNKQTGELIATKELLGKLDGATIRGGRLGRYGARILGATIGSQGSIPIISPVLGAFMGDAIVSGLQKAKIAGPINRLLMKVAQTAPDNSVVNDTLKFVQAVESGQKVMPTDDVAEFLARLSAQANIPLLPPAAHDAFKSVVGSGAPINLPAKSLSTKDAEHLANSNVKPPPATDPSELKARKLLMPRGENPIPLPQRSSTQLTNNTAKTIEKNVNIPPTLPPIK